jgi:hypothetical protein
MSMVWSGMNGRFFLKRHGDMVKSSRRCFNNQSTKSYPDKCIGIVLFNFANFINDGLAYRGQNS